MPEIDDIISIKAETLEDIFKGLFCECSHLLSEHSIGECKSLNYNGVVWMGCRCKQVRQAKFEIKCYVPTEFSTDRTENGTKTSKITDFKAA